MMGWQVEQICTGQPAPIGRRKKSAIAKVAVPGRVAITALGVGDDVQVDLVHHGGPDMAVHLYPQDHCDWWAEHTGDERLAPSAAFGSNLVVRGLLEEDVNLGSRFRLGDAVLQACQPRQPCATIEARFDRKSMVMDILSSGRCGWFFRVLEPGEAEAGDILERLDDGDPKWSMARVFAVLWGPQATIAVSERSDLADHALLPERLRAKIIRQMKMG